MPAKKKTPSSKRTRKTTPAHQPIPPMISALLRFTEPEIGMPEQFVTAWRQMPAFVATLEIGKGDSGNHVTHYGIVDQMVKDQIARSRQILAGSDELEKKYRGQLARTVDVLEAIEKDGLSDLMVTVEEPAFFVGMAFACYMLTHGVQR